MDRPENASRPGPSGRDRRRAPRVEVLGQLHGAIVALRMPIVVRDAGPGGFSIETALPFPEHAEHQFRFTPVDSPPIVLTATSVYCLMTSPADAEPRYLTGFEFAQTDESNRKEIADLVEALTGALTTG
jgi:hypothetical protein